MTWLPEGTLLGTLEIVETFVDYDGPRVFHARNRSGQSFLAEWADQTDEHSFWLYVPVSSLRLSAVRSGGQTLRFAFENPEDGHVYGVAIPNSGKNPEISGVQELRPSALEDDWLPDPDFTIDLSTDTLPRMKSGSELATRAAQDSRSRFRLELIQPSKLRSEAPSRLIGDLLVEVQNTLDNFGASLTLPTAPPQRGPLPPDILSQTASDLVALEAASFVLELASSEYDDMFGNNLFATACQKLIDLMSIQLTVDGLRLELRELRPRAAKRFKDLVQKLSASGGDVVLGSASARGGYAQQRMTADQLAGLYSILRLSVPEESWEIRGTLRFNSGNADRNRFGLKDDEANVQYTGRVDDSALASFQHAELNAMYDALLLESGQTDAATGETTPSYVLVQLTEPSDPALAVTRRAIT